MKKYNLKKQRQHAKNGFYFGLVLFALGFIGALYYSYEMGFNFHLDSIPIYIFLFAFIGVGAYQAISSNIKLSKLNSREVTDIKQLKFDSNTTITNVVDVICEEVYSKEQIKSALRNSGFSFEEIQNAINQAELEITKIKLEEKESGERNMIIGILVLTVGIIFTAIGSGKVFYGAIAMGIGLMIKGYRDSQLTP